MAGVSVTVRPAKSLRIDFQAEPASVSKSEQSVLTWTAFDATKCVSKGDWSGDRPVQGRFDTGALTNSRTYSLECSNASFTELATVSVAVKSLAIEWQAPAQNEDGSVAADIAGYKVYWGATADTTDGSVTLNNPRQTSWEPDLPRGKYYFSVTAFDQDGNESEPSKAILKDLS
jgi:hypothetical protein